MSQEPTCHSAITFGVDPGDAASLGRTQSDNRMSLTGMSFFPLLEPSFQDHPLPDFLPGLRKNLLSPSSSRSSIDSFSHLSRRS
jgi:hypothetical protein